MQEAGMDDIKRDDDDGSNGGKVMILSGQQAKKSPSPSLSMWVGRYRPGWLGPDCFVI